MKRETAQPHVKGTAAKKAARKSLSEEFNAARADRLFRNDPHWIGGDGAYSVDLGDGRVLWLFGDSFINTDGKSTRSGANLVHNCIGIQDGADPQTASIEYAWRDGADGKPAAFFQPRQDDGSWLWPGHGARLDDGGLVLFMMRIRGTGVDEGGDALGFRESGWEAVYIDNPDAPPAQWNMHWMDTPEHELAVMAGAGGVLREGGYLYAFGTDDGAADKPLHAARWREEDVGNKDLSRMEWWCGDKDGWRVLDDDAEATPEPLFSHGQTEQSIHRDAKTGTFICIQSEKFGEADIVMRTADALEGPWSAPEKLHAPPKTGRDGRVIYAAKAHPQLCEDGDIVLTYVTNTLDFEELFKDPDVYYPRFVKAKPPAQG